jgi:large subunit ribosomal protein L4
MVRLALKSALSDRVNTERLLVVDEWGFTEPSTKKAIATLEALGITTSVLIVVDSKDIAVAKSFRNLYHAQVIQVNELNAYDVLCNEWIIFSKATLPVEKAAQ